MDEGKTLENVELTKMEPLSPTSDPISTGSELNVPEKETPIDEAEVPPIAPGPGEGPVSAQTAAHEQQSNLKIGNRPYRLICLLCLFTAALIIIVVALSIHVSLIRQSQITSNRDYHLLLEDYNEMNLTLESKIFEISHLNLSLRSCLKNLSTLNSNLSDHNRRHSDLRHQFTEMKTKIRSDNEVEARFCQSMTSRREQECSKDWIRNEDRCYFISTFTRSYDEAKQHCCNSESILLEINSTEEEHFVNYTVGVQGNSYWIGKCKDGDVTSNVVYNISAGKFECGECKSREGHSCNNDQHRFICEKSAPLCPDFAEMILFLCEEPPGSTYIQEQLPLSPPFLSASLTNRSSLP
ncbi:oxidized low-density lipoprotein receptor 1-like isoform X2 [Hypanus sabinus]|uniref:oxidized low-density lipoprotein receptor 1-like isoform X2 n=1 Tax=Hypanus sabinus TaxID=79690 RepID=UPI0028C462E7|nr:oxidized low-density lipoprotein receptor 1-like isoform X2 [Hypanus sabinus]